MAKNLVSSFHQGLVHLMKLYIHGKVFLGPHVSIKQSHKRPSVIISLTTFPPRIGLTWLAIESVFQQSTRPDKIVLVLAEEEFPNRALPKTIRWQQARGLEVLWVRQNGKSFDKLIPTRKKYPEANIVTIDDDKILPRYFLKTMLAAHSTKPSSIIGYRGWEMKSHSGILEYGKGWERATTASPSARLFLPGNAGILYPPGALSEILHNLAVAHEICPTNDDFWFWGVAHQSGSEFFCLGMPAHTPVAGQQKTPALSHVNTATNNQQFQDTINYFGLREMLTIATAEG